MNLLPRGSAPLDMVNQTLNKRIMALQSKLEKETLGIPVKLYRIGELVNYTPFSRQTIHNYTIMGLIREASWTEGGHRLYDESVFERLSEILRLRRTKTLSQIREILSRTEHSDRQSPTMTEEGEPKKS